MKKLSFLFCLLILLSAFTCDNEPLDNDITIPDTNASCETATQEVAAAALAFTNIGDDNYTELCTAYKTALENLIIACGDPDGSIQSGIDALGDCANPNGFDDCEAAENATNLAEVNFNNATDENYYDYCVSYKLALQNQILMCGDADGSIQAIIDGLDCTQASPSGGSITLVAGTLPITFDIITVVVENGIIKVTGETSSASNYSVYFEVEEGATGTDIINDTFELTLTSTFFPSTQGFEDYTSTIDTNTSGALTGSFWGVVTNADGGDLSLTSGVIDITY
jgi:hypothetical protein